MTAHDPSRAVLHGVLLDDETTLTVEELCRACGIGTVQIETWVAEGVIEPRDPAGPSRDDWRFAGPSLSRMRTAVRLERDLAVNPPGVALALELLDEIAALRARLSSSSRPRS